MLVSNILYLQGTQKLLVENQGSLSWNLGDITAQAMFWPKETKSSLRHLQTEIGGHRHRYRCKYEKTQSRSTRFKTYENRVEKCSHKICQEI